MLKTEAPTAEEDAERKAKEDAAEKRAALRADLAKYLGEEVWDAGAAMAALQTLTMLLSGELWEAEGEPEQIAALRDAIDRVKAFIVSEIQENNDDTDPVNQLEMAAGRLADLSKAGKRNSGADQARIQKCHDLMKDCGASCESAQGKAAGASPDELEKAQAENAALREELGKIAPALEAIKADVAKIKNAPVPARAAVNALGVANGGGGAPIPSRPEEAALELLGKMTGEQRADFLMKAALRAPIDLSMPPHHR